MKLSTKLAFVSFAALLAILVAVLVTEAPVGVAVLVVVVGVALPGYAYVELQPMTQIVETTEQIAEGNTDLPSLAEGGNGEMQRMAIATNQLRIQYEESLRRARDLAAGRIGVIEVEDRVLRTGALSDADETTRGTVGPLEDAMIQLSNQMRKMTIQARVISRDQLKSPLLDERIPGELGDAFSLMVRNLRALTARAREIAAGDLTGRVEGEGELTEAFNKMVDRFHALAKEITQTGIYISSSAEEILAVLREQEFAASHQASGVEETQRTMETLLSSAKRIAESAQTVFKSAERTQANNRTVAKRIAELKTHSERISELLEVIKSIADRSDLLALNASLEGMRAGEAGKGFTLVAAEMRRLAESIKESVGDIKELLSDVRESALASVMATEEGSNLSERTTESALKITLITQQQQSGTEQVTQSMEELSTLINHGVAGMRQVTSAADELVNMSEDLRGVVEQFQTGATAATSGEFPRRASGKRSSVSSPERRSKKVKEAMAVAAAAHEERKALSQSLGEPSSSVFDELNRQSPDRKSFETVPGGIGAAGPTETPTIEFAGMSEQEEREMLAEALRSSNHDRELSEVSDTDDGGGLEELSDASEVNRLWEQLGSGVLPDAAVPAGTAAAGAADDDGGPDDEVSEEE